MIFAGKIYKIPNFYMIFARKMPDFHIIIARKMFLPNFRGHVPPLPPVSYAYDDDSLLACYCWCIGMSEYSDGKARS